MKCRLDNFYELIKKNKFYRYNVNNLKYYYEYLFRDIPLSGKNILDVGGGVGLLGLYCICRGSDNLLLLEPESAGSINGNKKKFDLFIDELSLINVTFSNATFQDYRFDNKKYDVVIFHNSINHLDEKACISLGHHENALEIYHKILLKLESITKPGSVIIICDCSRYNFFSLLKIKNPFSPMIEWEKHQSPELWIELFKDHNFGNSQVRWIPPKPLRTIGRKLIGNKYLSFFLTSYFCLSVEKLE